MALLSGAAVYPLLIILIPLFEPVTLGRPVWVAVLPVVAVAVPMMTWVVMPLLNRVLARWLEPARAADVRPRRGLPSHDARARG